MPILPGQVLGTVRMAVRVRVGVRVMARARASPPPTSHCFRDLEIFSFHIELYFINLLLLSGEI